MKHAGTQALYSYWDSLRGDRAAPERADIDPAAIRAILADTLLIEVDQRSSPSNHDFAVRLGGTRVNALFGEDLKGRDFLSLWCDEDRESVSRLVTAVLDDACPAVAGLLAAPAGHQPVWLELLLLPLRHHGKTHARLLGSLVPAEIPRWFGLMPTQPLRLTTQRMVAAPQAPNSLFAQAHRREMERSAPRRRQHLFVHEGGRQDSPNTAIVA